ncbi:MAG: tetratricopeptide repeat protein, partial [Pricia sp.]|nr:tetratricopeptide repeat protein [Pricia sp.]
MSKCLTGSVLLFFFVSGSAQFVPGAFKKTIDSLTRAAPKTFSEIHSVLRENKSDTVLMRHFLNVATGRNYVSGRIYALNELGRTYRNTSQYTKAVKFHEQALELANNANLLEFKVASLNDLGVVYRRVSSIRTAMDYNQQALELAETVSNPSRSLKRSINVSYNCIGNLYQMLQQYGQAILYFKKSLKLETELGNTLGIAINYQNIGECLEEQGELNQALENYRTSLAYNEEIDNDMGRVICKTSIAQIYLKQNRPEDATLFLELLLPLAEKSGDGFLIAPVYINLGWSQMLSEQYEAAETNMLEGLRIAEKYNIRE